MASDWRASLTPELLAKSVINHKIDRFDIRECSMCGYMCGYVFNVYGEYVDVYYDNGCYCTCRFVPSEREFWDVIKHIKMQNNPKVIEEYKNFWHL